MTTRPKYLRDPKRVLDCISGLDIDHRHALLTLIDQLAIHEGCRMPVSPPSYCAAMLGIGQRKWTQVISETLTVTGRIKQITADGRDWWVLCDPLLIEWPDHDWPDLDVQPKPESVEPMVKPEPEKQPEPVFPKAEEKPLVFERAQPASLVHTSPTPFPSAKDVLERAKIRADNHPRGQLYWVRTEHQDILREWAKTVPVNEIVRRLDAARREGILPDDPNSLADYTPFVMQEQL